MQAREADPRFSAQPTSPRLGRSDSKKKLGIFVKRTYAGMNKQTSKLTSSFRKDLPGGDDSEFDQQREEFEQLLRKVARLHKRVVRYNKTFSDMGSEMVELAQVLQSFGGGTEGNRFGEDFMQAASSMQQASASFSSGVAQIDQDLKAFYGQLKQYSKQVELRDAALVDLGKATRKVQKAKKRPEAIKSQQAEAHYEEIKQVYVFLNEEVKQQLQTYNSQRMLYIMPHLEKLSACHLDFLQQAMSGAAHLHQHRAHVDDPAQKGEDSAGRPTLYRSMTEGANLLTRSNKVSQRPLYARRQSNPELREVEPLIYRGVDTDSEDENENDDRDDDQKVDSTENEVVADEDDEPGGVAPFEALTSPRNLHAPTSETAALRSRAFSAPEPRQDAEVHAKPKKKKKTVVLLKKKNKKEDKKAKSKSKSKSKKANLSGDVTKAEDQHQHEDPMLKKRPSLDAGKEKQSKTESPDESEVRRASADESHAHRPEPSIERRPSFRRPAHVHPPARPTPPTPSPADTTQASDVSTPSYSTTSSLTSSFSSSSSSTSSSS